MILAVFASVASFLYFYLQGNTVIYYDAKAHELIAKRFWQSPTPGFGQLGAVWPLLPHLMMLPFVWNDYLFYSGIAGSIVSMLCFVATVPFVYKLTETIGGGKVGATVASLVFILNPNVLYMQSTPMSELPLFLFIAAGIYFFVKWTQNTEKFGMLMCAALVLTCATLTRYEAWFLLALVSVLVLFICLHQGFDRWKTLAHLIWFAPAYSGIVFWFGWNTLLKHDPLYFYRGEHSAPSLWVSAQDQTVGSIAVTFKTYWFGMQENLGLPMILLALFGGLIFVLRERKVGSLIALCLFFPFPFFMLTLYGGQRPMHVQQITGTLYNVRFALLMVLAIAVFAGYLAKRRLAYQIAVVLVAGGTLVYAFTADTIITLEEPQGALPNRLEDPQYQTATWLQKNYDEGYVLIESFGNEFVHFDSQIPMSKLLYEGSYRIWEDALIHPENYADWIVMRGGGGRPDVVWKSLSETQVLRETYVLVFENDTYEVYLRRDHPNIARYTAR